MIRLLKTLSTEPGTQSTVNEPKFNLLLLVSQRFGGVTVPNYGVPPPLNSTSQESPKLQTQIFKIRTFHWTKRN